MSGYAQAAAMLATPLLMALGGKSGGAGSMAPNPAGQASSSMGMSGQPIDPNAGSLGSTGSAMPQFTPMGSLSPQQQGGVNQALAANPSTAGLVGQVAGVDPMTPASSAGVPPSAAPASTQDAVNTALAANLQNEQSAAKWAGVGEVGNIYLNYLMQRQLERQRQLTAYAPEHSTPMSQMPGLSLMPPANFALPQIG